MKVSPKNMNVIISSIENYGMVGYTNTMFKSTCICSSDSSINLYLYFGSFSLPGSPNLLKFQLTIMNKIRDNELPATRRKQGSSLSSSQSFARSTGETCSLSNVALRRQFSRLIFADIVVHPHIGYNYWQGVWLIGQCGVEFFSYATAATLKEEGVSGVFSKYGMVYRVELSYSPWSL